ncbi:MAG: serine/threonine protein kinase [Planctomycetales bacterium]|nr:serine/threonine protein kinase [Planctomycetales bacterium]
MNTSWNRQQLLQEYKIHCSQLPLAEYDSDESHSLAHAFLFEREIDISTLGDDERQALLNDMESICDSCWANALPEHTPNEQADVLPPFVEHSTDPLGLPVRYRALHKIGEGGLGQIWRVLDTRLNRQVAIKTPRDEFSGHPRLWNRFFREAELTSQLQHPGIPPTYDAGRRSNGVPFFSMKLIEGETLANLLKNPAADHNRHQWLSRFASLVQTIAFAHDQGVIHRDLKPHNVMVSRFGELQVMDWGLARILHSGSLHKPEPMNETSTGSLENEQPQLLSGENLTSAGDVLGTPHYMSPEQARGISDKVGFTSDVFSLGAMLFEILAGRRLYEGLADHELIAQVALGPAGSLSQIEALDCDPTLKDLVRRCLSVNPADRPSNASEVAIVLSGYFEERDQRLRRAEAEQVKAHLRIEEERKRRKIAMGLVAVLLAGIAGTVWGLARASSEWQRAEQNALASAKNAQTASANAEIANEKAQLAERVVKNFYTRIGQEKLFDTPGLQPLRQELLDEALKFYVQATRESPDDIPLRLAHGELLLSSAMATFARGETTPALNLMQQGTEKLNSVLESAAPEMPSPARTGWTLADEARFYLGRARSFEGTARLRLGNPLTCIELYKESEALYQRLVKVYPNDIPLQRNLGEVYSAWGFLVTGSPNPENALPLLNQALALRQTIVNTEGSNEYDRHDLARTYWDIGYCQRLMSANAVGEDWEQLLEKTIDNYMLAIDTLNQLVEEYPGSMIFQTTQGEVYNTLAVAYSHRNDRGVMSSEERAENNRLAIEAHKKSLEVHLRLVAQNPGIERMEFNLSRTYMNYGVELKAAGQYAEAMDAYLKSVAIRREIVSRRPREVAFASGLANSLSNVGLLQLDHLEDAASAMQYLSEAEGIYQGLLEQTPGDRKLKMSLAAIYLNQGIVHRKQQEWDSSATCIESALETTAGESDQMLTIAKHAAQLASSAQLSEAESAPRLLQRGLEILGQLVEEGHIAIVDLDHPDFDCLKDSPEFKACREKLTASVSSP